MTETRDSLIAQGESIGLDKESLERCPTNQIKQMVEKSRKSHHKSIKRESDRELDPLSNHHSPTPPPVPTLPPSPPSTQSVQRMELIQVAKSKGLQMKRQRAEELMVCLQKLQAGYNNDKNYIQQAAPHLDESMVAALQNHLETEAMKIHVAKQNLIDLKETIRVQCVEEIAHLEKLRQHLVDTGHTLKPLLESQIQLAQSVLSWMDERFGSM